ncbi:MAG: hypothetical protein HWQ41_07385 [Nostoc sp. NOS(2021)]|uniref:hypothetical protein n=1 Tax=Nostoc sp. NOS(2021) TaxID=2815407 RepID=UPI0025DA0EED|nr:hypothetical protein [Nostoc sp. NOS(2021)]MBN3895081.1 hypothetical protein [Nostoc sp. NOS(2021)]
MKGLVLLYLFRPIYLVHVTVTRLYPKLRTRFSLSGKNPGFLANTFSTSQIIDEVKKVKLPSYKGFSDSDRIAKKMDKVERKRGSEILRLDVG